MEETSSVRALLPRLARTPPADLGGVFVSTVLVNVVVFTPVIRDTPVRIPIGLAFVLFVPGYAVVSATFPRKGPIHKFGGDDGEAETVDRPRSWWGRIDGVDRIAFSIALSFVVVSVIGFVVSIHGGFRYGPILLAVSGVTAIAAVVAVQRRSAVAPAERFKVPVRSWLATVRSALVESDTRGAVVLNVALIGAVILALVSVGYAATVLPQDDEFSSITVLPDGNGEIDVDEPPIELVSGESHEVTIGVDNHEGGTVDYTLVAVEQAVDLAIAGEESGSTVVEQRELDRFEATVDDGETWRLTHTVEPSMDDEGGRIVWLLYVDGNVPDEPSIETADNHVYVFLSDGTDD